MNQLDRLELVQLGKLDSCSRARPYLSGGRVVLGRALGSPCFGVLLADLAEVHEVAHVSLRGREEGRAVEGLGKRKKVKGWRGS